jgi:hypothetical protein
MGRDVHDGGNKNDSKKVAIDLLERREMPRFHLRSLGGEFDLFIPSRDIFISLNKEESFLFDALFIKKLELDDVFSMNGSYSSDSVKEFAAQLSEAVS